MSKYIVLYLTAVEVEIGTLSIPDQARIKAAEEALVLGDFQALYIKSLKGPIRELIVGNYRLVFFYWKENSILFVDIFRKKSNKTPLRIIRHAERIYKMVMQRKE